MPLPVWLQRYVERGFRLVFYPPRLKGPTGAEATGWTTRIYRPEDYKEGDNVGLMLGVEIAPGRYLIDVDLDWDGGLALAKTLLPSTDYGFGRISRPISHALYASDRPLVSRRFDDVDNETIVEIRGTKADGTLGFQTMAPPSLHPDEETIELKQDGDLGLVTGDLLERRVALYALGCLIVKHLGARGVTHDVRLTLTGWLIRREVEDDDVTRVLTAICHATGNDARDAETVVATTAARFRRGDPITSKLTDHLDAKIVTRLAEWVGGGEFDVDQKGRVIPNLENITRGLERLGIVLTHDTFSHKHHAVWPEAARDGPLDDALRDDASFELEKRFGLKPRDTYLDRALGTIARTRPTHPVKEYLNALVWDKTPRLDEWLITYGGAGESDYTRFVGRATLLAAVRRIQRPGCKFDELLILESEQGTYKSSALRALCPNEEWFSDDLPLNVEAKQMIERTSGKWIIEASELAGLRNRDMEHLKATLSRQVDGPVRMAYARLPVEVARQFIIIGTTNSYSYLTDQTGNRRFWSVRVKRFDVEAIRGDRDQLWAEAVERERHGESTAMPEAIFREAEIQQERRRNEDPWEAILAPQFTEDDRSYRVTARSLWATLGIPIGQRDAYGGRRIADIMQHLGFRRMTIRGTDGVPLRGWGRDGKLPFDEVIDDES